MQGRKKIRNNVVLSRKFIAVEVGKDEARKKNSHALL